MTSVRDEVAGIGSDLAPSQQEKDAVRGFVSDVTRDVKQLVQQEVALAKAEISAEAGKVGKGAGMLGGAAFAGIMAVVFLSTALWWALANVMDQSWAALIVAGLWLVIAAVLFVVGRGTLRSISLKPERTINSLKKIPGAVKPPARRNA
ncbi:Putative Holin-X, holin superfamily III [Jatrophihabitans endophyticus]|uniref:Putative Holin-X, holin superfamily III n=1 Tax=Jatrophihabitans endophyticus TaxID=1206085 RepID=A0A1M5E1Q8_9ACTN|nr:phage holin family protein [Jatrophihabitans endophyticus]SHF73173.1 Putative Holin-X, holin superfamily III [Jatrophihabitans endophyticus]